MERRHELKLEVAKYERILQKSTENQVDQVEEAIRGCIRLVGINVDDLKPFVYGRESIDYFIDHYYSSVGTTLLRQVSLQWKYFIDPSAMDLFFSPIYAPASQVFATICSCLASSPDILVATECCRLLEQFFASGGIKYIQQMSKEQDSVVHYLASLPSLIFNKMSNDKIVDLFTPTVYFQRLAVDLVQHKSENPLFFQKMVVKLAKLDALDAIAHEWTKQVASDVKDMALHCSLFDSMADKCLEKLVWAILQQTCLSQEIFVRWMKNKAATSTQMRYVLCERLVLARIVPARVMPWIVELLKAASREILHVILKKVAVIWSAEAFAQRTDYNIQQSITSFVVLALERSTKAEIEQYNLIPLLSKGVGDHMSHSTARVRQLGMHVAKQMSILIDKDNPIVFDDVLTHEPEVVEEKPSGIPISTTQKRMKRLDPDEIIDSEDEPVSENESEDSLEPYDLNDDESDLLPCPKPVYLYDCLVGFQATDKRDETEAALNGFAELVRRRPLDLTELAPDLAKALVRLEDMYSTSDFESKRQNGLIALCVCAPMATVPSLTPQVFDFNVLFQARLDILNAMIHSAYELCGNPISTTERSKPRLLMEERTDESLSSKTRRWGYRRDPLSAPKKNEFATYAGLFFYPLLYGYKPKNDDLEGQFLAYLLHALSCFVECSGHSPTTIPMARCLLDFICALQKIQDNIAVKKQLIFALSRVLMFLPSFVKEEMNGQLNQMFQFLQYTSRSDSDESCRNASLVMITNLK